MNYEDRLLELALAREEVVVMTAENRAAIRNLPARLGSRFIDVGIAEQTLVGAAAGLALRGRVPVVHALAAFLTMRAFEFIRTDVGIPCLPVKLIGFVPGLLSDANGPTHQAIEDVALMRTIPNMMVFCPADGEELVRALPEILSDPRPCYVRYTAAEPVVVHSSSFSVGRVGTAETLASGTDVTILAHGVLLDEAAKAQRALEAEKISAGLVNVSWITPLDERVLLDVALRSRRLVVVEDHLTTGGLYAAVCELLMRHRIVADVSTVSLRGRWFRPGLLPDIVRREGFSAEAIADVARRAVTFENRTPESRRFEEERARDAL